MLWETFSFLQIRPHRGYLIGVCWWGSGASITPVRQFLCNSTYIIRYLILTAKTLDAKIHWREQVPLSFNKLESRFMAEQAMHGEEYAARHVSCCSFKTAAHLITFTALPNSNSTSSCEARKQSRPAPPLIKPDYNNETP